MRILKLRRFIVLSGLCFVLAACSQATIIPDTQAYDQSDLISSIYWSDGDSGRITLQSGEVLKFRLNDIDAPETGGVGAAIGGAKCEKERELGYEAKEWAVTFTRGANLDITASYGQDRYKRHVIDLMANNNDVRQAGIQAGFYRSWKHDGKRALSQGRIGVASAMFSSGKNIYKRVIIRGRFS